MAETLSEILAKVAEEDRLRRAAKKKKGESKFVTQEGQEGTGEVGKGWGISRKNTTAGQPRQGETDVSMGNSRPPRPSRIENQE
jgi:hypothetical protein